MSVYKSVFQFLFVCIYLCTSFASLQATLPSSQHPIFIGYTSKPLGSSEVVENLEEFEQLLGLAPSYEDMQTGNSTPDFLLAFSLEIFWKNGGEKARVISLGNYTQEGETKSAAHYRTLLPKLANYPTSQLIILPDAILLPSTEYGQVCQEALLAGKKYGKFVLLDVQATPTDATTDAAQRFRSLVAGPNLREGAAYWPYVKLANSPWMGPSGLIAGKMSALDKSRGVWKAPAGTEAVFAQQIQVQLSQPEIQSLQQDPGGMAINPLRMLPGKGIVIWGTRTLAGNDKEWRYIPVRRLALLLDREVNKILTSFASSPHTATTWTEIKKETEALLMDFYRKGAFPASKASSAFFVKIGLRETMTQRDIDQGKRILQLGFAPLKPAEFIVLKLTHTIH